MKRKNSWIGLLYILPSFLGIALFYLYPFITSLKYSFTKGVFDDTFVAFDNYIRVLNSEAFQLAIKNTVKFYIITFPLIMIISLFFAVLVSQYLKGNTLFKKIFVLPLVIPTASLVLFISILFGDGGILGSILNSETNYIDSPYAFAILVLLFLFKYTGYNVILYISGICEIDPRFYEEARICGASKFQEFRYITEPLLRPTSFLVFIFTMINSFHIYREAYYIGGEYPHESIYMIQHYLRNNYSSLSYQRLSAASVILFLGIMAVLLTMYIIHRRREKNK